MICLFAFTFIIQFIFWFFRRNTVILHQVLTNSTDRYMKRFSLAIFMLALTLTTTQAQVFDNLPDPIEDVNKVVDNTPDSIAKALMSRPAPGSTRIGSNPVLFLIGNSTMRNGTKGDGSNGQWGWGYYANQYFNANKITVENQALGGMSTRTFYTKLWPAAANLIFQNKS